MKIKLKAFHAEFLNDHAALAEEEKNYQPIPEIRKITQEEVMENYFTIKKEIRQIIEEEMEKIKNHPEAKAIVAKAVAAQNSGKGGGRGKQMKSL
jgi:hypothetical protein